MHRGKWHQAGSHRKVASQAALNRITSKRAALESRAAENPARGERMQRDVGELVGVMSRRCWLTWESLTAD